MAEIDIRQGRTLQAISPPSPRLTYHEEEIATGGSIGTGALREWHIGQEFDLPLLLGLRGSAPRYLRDAAGQRLQYVRMQVRTNIIRSYATYYARIHQFHLHEENLRLATEFARKAELRHAAGESSALEAARARAEEAAARIGRERAQQALQEAAGALATASGERRYLSPEDLRPPISVDSLVPRDPGRFLDPPGLPEEREAAVPWLAAARAERNAAQANASWRWMEFLPRFEVSWFRQEFRDIGRHWGTELSASIPLWAFLDTRGAMEEHHAAARQAEAQYETVRQEFVREAANARQALRTTAAGYLAYRDNLLAEAARMTDTAERGYDSGEIGYMEYLAARQSANDVALGYYDILAELFAAVAQYELITDSMILE